MSEALRQRGVSTGVIRRRGGTAVLRIPTQTAGPNAWTPGAEGAPVDLPCLAFVFDYTQTERNNNVEITDKDKHALLACPIMNGAVEVVPERGWRLVQGGATYTVMSVSTLNPDGVTNIQHDVQVRV